MTRPIKFRAKSVHGVWWYGSLNPSSEHRQVNLATFFANLYAKGGAFISETLGEYTDRKDKNGKEIFEGDIAQFPDASGAMLRQEVIFNRGAFVTESGRMWGFNKDTGNLEDYEVIGNIHDTKPTEKGE